MPLKIRKYLFDIQIAIHSIHEYLGDETDFDKYLENKLLRSAVERELEIIGEAANKLLRSYPEFPIEDARKLVDLRNFIIHGYDKVDDMIIWGVIKKHLPLLKEQVDQFLKA